MSAMEFVEDEMNQLMIERELNAEGNRLAQMANKIIDMCIMIPESSRKSGSEIIKELVKELDGITREYEKKVRDNKMWDVGFGDVGLNHYTMLVKTYKRTAEMLKTKAFIMNGLSHDGPNKLV